VPASFGPRPSSSKLPLGPLPAGRHEISTFIPHARLLAPDGLILRAERPENLWLSTGYARDGAEFNLIQPDEVGAVDRVSASAKVTSSRPQPISINGVDGRFIDVSVAPGAYPMTNRNAYEPAAVIVAGTTDWYFYIPPGARARIIELTVAGRQVLIFYEAQLSAYDAFAAIVEPMVASLEFEL
jgi:hypothetical protein